MRHTKILAVIAGVLTCSLIHTGKAQAGDVYKYVDERGTTLYTSGEPCAMIRPSWSMATESAIWKISGIS